MPAALGLLAHRLEEREAGGEDRGLGVHGQVELFGRTLEDHPRQRNAERGVGTLVGGGSGGRARDEIGAHPHVLGALAGEHEGDGARRRRVARIGQLGQFGGLRLRGMLRASIAERERRARPAARLERPA